MAELKNEEGYMFNKEEKSFIEFLVEQNRVCLFKQAEKENAGKPLQYQQENLMKLVKDANYVKSKKIKNIISESAKLAIRELIDKLSEEADSKMVRLSETLVKEITLTQKKTFGGSLEDALEVKKKLLSLIEHIEKSKNEEIV